MRKSLNDFKFSTFVGHVPSDTLASMAVKGLKSVSFLTLCVFESPFRTLEVNFVSGGFKKKKTVHSNEVEKPKIKKLSTHKHSLLFVCLNQNIVTLNVLRTQTHSHTERTEDPDARDSHVQDETRLILSKLNYCHGNYKSFQA